MPLLTLQSAKGYGFGSLVAAADAASDMELISSTTLGSTQSSVSFGSLNTVAAAYRHLRVVVLARANVNLTAQSITVELNGSSAANYNVQSLFMYATPSSVIANSWTYFNQNSSASYCGGAEGQTAYQNLWQPNIYEFHDFSQTDKNKYITNLNGCISTDTNGFVAWNNLMWNQTNAITSITFNLAANFSAGSRFALYGLK